MKQFHSLCAALSLLICCSDVAAQHGQTASARLVALPQVAGIASGTVTLSRDANFAVVRDQQGLVFFDGAGQRRDQVPGNFLKVAIAATGKPGATPLVAAVEKPEPSRESGDNGLLLHIFHADGTAGAPAWRWPLAHGFDEPLPHLCFDGSANTLLLANSATAKLTFFSSQGVIIQRVDLFKDAPFSLERPVFLASGANHFVVLSQIASATPESIPTPVVALFSSTGEEKWRRTLAPGTAGGLVVSAAGRRLAACRYVVSSTGRVEASTAIFDQQGKKLAELPLLFRHGWFSSSGEMLALASRENLLLVQSADGKIIVEKGITGAGEIIASLAVDENQNTVALIGRSEFAAGGFQLTAAALIGIGPGGEEIFRTVLGEALAGTPMLAYNGTSGEFVLAADGVLQRYRLERVIR